MGTVARGGAVLLLGGALGNFVDRLGGAGVVDYLHTGWFPTFNFADVFVVTGAAVLVGALGVFGPFGGMGMFGLLAACVACVYLAGPRQEMGPATRR